MESFSYIMSSWRSKLFFFLMFISPIFALGFFVLIERVKKKSFREARVVPFIGIIFFFGHLVAQLGLYIFFRFSLAQILDLLKDLPLWFIRYYCLTSFFAGVFLLVYYIIEEKIDRRFRPENLPASRDFYRAGWISFIATFFYIGINWYHVNLPQGEPLSLFFAIVLPKEGIDNSMILKGFMEIPLQLFILNSSLLMFLAPFWRVLYLKSSKIILNGIWILLLAGSFLNLFFLMKPLHYIKQAGAGLAKPVSSEFFQKNYVDTKNVPLKFPDQKRNLIWIFMESMESSAQSYEEGG